jgi:general secretion pathway protein C
MLQRFVTFGVWTLVGGSLMLLALKLLPSPLTAPPGVQALAPEAPPPASLSRLFGQSTLEAPPLVATPTDGRFRLLGVVAPRDAGLQTAQGVALLSIDGGPPKAYRVGQVVDGEMRLLAVEAGAAGLGQNGVIAVQLQLQTPPAAATGSLPPALGSQVAPMPAQMPPGMPLRVSPPDLQPPTRNIEVPMPAMEDRSPDSTGPRRPPAIPNVQSR